MPDQTEQNANSGIFWYDKPFVFQIHVHSNVRGVSFRRKCTYANLYFGYITSCYIFELAFMDTLPG